MTVTCTTRGRLSQGRENWQHPAHYNTLRTAVSQFCHVVAHVICLGTHPTRPTATRSTPAAGAGGSFGTARGQARVDAVFPGAMLTAPVMCPSAPQDAWGFNMGGTSKGKPHGQQDRQPD